MARVLRRPSDQKKHTKRAKNMHQWNPQTELRGGTSRSRPGNKDFSDGEHAAHKIAKRQLTLTKLGSKAAMDSSQGRNIRQDHLHQCLCSSGSHIRKTDLMHVAHHGRATHASYSTFVRFRNRNRKPTGDTVTKSRRIIWADQITWKWR